MSTKRRFKILTQFGFLILVTLKIVREGWELHKCFFEAMDYVRCSVMEIEILLGCCDKNGLGLHILEHD